MPAVSLDANAVERFNAGQPVLADSAGTGGLVRVYAGENEFVGIGELSGDGKLAPKRVFHMGEKNP